MICAGGGSGGGRERGGGAVGVTRGVVLSGSLFFVVVLGRLVGRVLRLVVLHCLLFLLILYSVRRAVTPCCHVGLRGSSR